MSTNLRPMNAALQLAAKEQLNEVPARIEEDLRALRTWIEQQAHLNSRTDEQFLVGFLRGCKFSLERAKYKLENYYTLRTQFPELFTISDVDAPAIKEIIRLGCTLYLPTPLNESGPRILILRCGSYSVDKYNIQDVMRVANALMEIVLIEDDYAVVNGVVFIVDVKGATIQHFMQMTPTLMARLIAYSEEGVPLRPQAVHYINTITAFTQFFNITKPMLSKKLQARLHVHGDNMDSLAATIPLKYLPKEYGGENGSVAEIMRTWEKKLEQYRDYFKEGERYGVIEQLRPVKMNNIGEFYGYEGSFRKLEVD